MTPDADVSCKVRLRRARKPLLLTHLLATRVRPQSAFGREWWSLGDCLQFRSNRGRQRLRHLPQRI